MIRAALIRAALIRTALSRGAVIRVTRAGGPGSRERGTVAIVAAIAMMSLLGVVALVTDIGLARQHNAQAQAAADSAALGGAIELYYDMPSSAMTTAVSLAANNDFPLGTVALSPPATGTRIGDTSCIEVTTHDSVDTIFGSILGRSTIDVGGRAVACANGYTTVPAIFANSQNCNDKTLTFNGSNNSVLGWVHSNDELHLPGSNNNFFSGDFDYVSILDIGGSGNSFDPGNPKVGMVEPMPVDFDIADYQPGGARAADAIAAGIYHNAGNNKIDTGWLESNTSYNSGSGVMEPGLYYTSDEIDLSASDLSVNATGVTFVSSNGMVKLAGSDHDLTPWDPGQLLVFSNLMGSSPITNPSNCDTAAVDMSGSNTNWAGIVFAPRGQIKLAGSSNTTIQGSVIGHSVELSGSTLSIDSTGLGAGDPQIQLVE